MNLLKTFFAFSLVIFGLTGASVFTSTGYEVGDQAMDFKLKNVDGRWVSLSDYKSAKGFIVVFDCNICPYSKAYNSRIMALNKRYSPLGFPVIAINPNDPTLSPGDSFEEMKRQASEKKYDFPYLIDETQEVIGTFGATNTPHVFVLKKAKNKLVVAYIGTIDDNSGDAAAVNKRYVEDAVEALLHNKETPLSKTKAIGCAIKWKNS